MQKILLLSDNDPTKQCDADKVPPGWVLVSSLALVIKGDPTAIPRVPDKTLNFQGCFASRADFAEWLRKNL